MHLVFYSLTQFEKKIARFVRAAGWQDTKLRNTYGKMVPRTIYKCPECPDIQGRKKASILKLRNFATSFGIRSSRAIQSYI
eukprot:SAG11_NODE_6095_length_1389_cov_1.706977_1_plen_81_part_00